MRMVIAKVGEILCLLQILITVLLFVPSICRLRWSCLRRWRWLLNQRWLQTFLKLFCGCVCVWCGRITRINFQNDSCLNRRFRSRRGKFLLHLSRLNRKRENFPFSILKVQRIYIFFLSLHLRKHNYLCILCFYAWFNSNEIPH